MFWQWPWETVKVKCISVDRSLDAQSLLFWQCLHCTILPICGMVSRPPIHCDLGGLVKVKVAKVKLEPKTYVYPIDEHFWWKKVHKIQQYHWKIDLTVITAVTAIFQYQISISLVRKTVYIGYYPTGMFSFEYKWFQSKQAVHMYRRQQNVRLGRHVYLILTTFWNGFWA